MTSPAKPASLRISAIVHATEDSRKVSKAIRNICQLESAEPEANRAKGHYGNQITTLELTLKKPKDVENSMRNIWGRLNTIDEQTVFSSLALRVDSSAALFLRLDKQEAFKGIIRLQDADPIKVAVSFSTSWSKQDGVVSAIQKFLTVVSSNAARSL